MDKPAKDVLRFIERRIDTVPDIEALLLLWDDRPRTFTLGEIATRIFVSDAAATRILKGLQQKGLVTTDGEPPTYRYDPAWDSKGELMPRVAETYRRHLIQVTSLIHSKASPGVREFARAFEPKKE